MITNKRFKSHVINYIDKQNIARANMFVAFISMYCIARHGKKLNGRLAAYLFGICIYLNKLVEQ